MIILISVCFGLSICFMVWQLYFIFESVPIQDRAWWDRPAVGFRIVWPLIKIFDYYGSKMYSASRHELVNAKLHEAGLEFTLTSGQFIASRWVSAISMAILCYLTLKLLDSSLYFIAVVAVPWGYIYPDLWIKRVVSVRRRRMDKDLPFYLDVVTLSVESGTNLTGALTQAVQKAPDSPL